MFSALVVTSVRAFSPLKDRLSCSRASAALAQALFSSTLVNYELSPLLPLDRSAHSSAELSEAAKVAAASQPVALERTYSISRTQISYRDSLSGSGSLQHDTPLRHCSQSAWSSLQARQFSSTLSNGIDGKKKSGEGRSVGNTSGVIETSSPPASEPFIARVLPRAFLPYAMLMRLDKPIGTWLLAWPCFWSIAMAAPSGSLPDPKMIALFGTGALLLRGAGCTVNDLWDKDLDRKVERTRGRPLASGELSVPQGIGLLGGQLLLGLGILLQLNHYSIALGAASLGLVFTYPLMKRVTFWPQAFLGLTFNWGALLGYAAVQGSCNWPVVLPLYFGGVCWTLVYDTIYAHQDKADDVHAGVKSTALLFGKNTRPWLSGFAVGATSFWALSGYMMGSALPFYAGVATASSHMLWQIWSTNLEARSDCMATFVSNKWLGSLIFSGIVLDKLCTI